MTAPQPILDLVERFDHNLDAYHSGHYKEAQLRIEFLNPFFEILGWDMANRQGYTEAYKEVVHEDAILVGSATKAPDYSFRIGGTRKFFVEAKKPSVRIAGDPGAAFQLRRYAWSAKLPLSILTDFEEFAVYDCRVRPVKTDKPTTARVSYIRYTDFPDKWDEIAGVFAKDAILKGSFDRYVESKKVKGTEVDTAFLVEIERWRDILARNLALRNPDLSVSALNYAVQTIIDRIIFLRICEDRGIEPYGRLRSAAAGSGVYGELVEMFRQADSRYNSGLFYFRAEKGRPDKPDTFTPGLTVDDKLLKDIIGNLYYPDSPYEFSVLPVEILGQVYEQFLGKVIRLTAGHQAKVEDKPEVKKAGGVYYTPTYIVEYIVRQTVGKLCEGRTPDQVSQMRILDPACGSGSFLLGAYQYLLDWHRDYYTAHTPTKYARGGSPALRQVGEDWQLTTAERKRILLNNIYGVDIDHQAVEVTKLSLLLKVLEGENGQTLTTQLQMFQERALPDLGSNIKCGNSLIGPDYAAGQLLPDPAEIAHVNPFDWQAGFPDVIQAGGFDAVIGNPPYVRSINLKESDPLLWDLYRSRYRSASSREWDIYLIVVEKGLSLLKADGRLGYILPNKFLNSQVGENLRAILSEGHYLDRLVHFGAFQVFQGVTTYTCLLFLDRAGKDHVNVARYIGPVDQSRISCPLPEESPELWAVSQVLASKLTADAWEFTASGGALLERLKQWPALGSVAQIFQGTGTRADKVYLVENRGQEGDLVRIYSYEKELEYLLEPTFLKAALRGRSIGRYKPVDQKLLLVVPYEVIEGKSVLTPQAKLAELAPNTLDYLRECKPRLDEREKGRFKGRAGWYAYGYPRSMTKFSSFKIVMPDVCNRGKCWLEDQPHWLIDTAYGIVALNDKIDLCYLTGILNSPLLTYFLKETGTALRGGYFRMKTAYLNPFPIRLIDFSAPADVARHDQMVQLVERMLDLHKRLAAAQSPHDKTQLQRQIEATDKQIDALVYELYGLTDEEIRIVEGEV